MLLKVSSAKDQAFIKNRSSVVLKPWEIFVHNKDSDIENIIWPC